MTQPEHRGRRRRLPAALIAVGSVIAVVSATSTWVRTQALETDRWVDTSSALLDEADVQERLASYLTDQLYASVDVAAALEALLPDDLAGLAGPLAGLVREQVTDATQRLLASEGVADLWESVNRTAHETLVRILRDETRGGVSAAEGVVALELRPVLVSVGEAIGLPESALDQIPESAGRVVVFESDELAAAQTSVQVLDFLSWFLFLAVVLLYALAVYLAEGRRRETLRSVGFGLVSAGVALLLIRTLAVRLSIDLLAVDRTNEGVAALSANVGTELLRQIAWSGVVDGALIVGFATLLGSRRTAVAIRAFVSRSANPTGLVVAGTAAVLLVAAWWSPGRAFDRWETALTLLGLATGAVTILLGKIRDEYGVHAEHTVRTLPHVD